MNSLRPPRRHLAVLLAIALLVSAGCNMPGIAPSGDFLFPTATEVPYEELLLQLTGTAVLDTPTPTESPQGRQFIQAAQEETQPVTVTDATSTPPPTVTTGPERCRVPALSAGGDQVIVYVYFHCDEQLTSVPRLVPQGTTEALAAAALQALLSGPSVQERAAGFNSWFSSQTAGTLTSLTPGRDGMVTVNLVDFSRVIPNASSSAGSQMLVDQISATLFQFPDYGSLLITFGGDCNRFWNWLQSDCSLVQRAP
jgi:spore germination protein GerM